MTLLAAFIVREQVVELPEQAPDQPEKPNPEEGEAVRNTFVPWENEVPQTPGQEMPAGELITVPLPVPPLTLTESDSGTALNVAFTPTAAFIVTMQMPVPEQAPDQPPKV